MSRGQRSGLVRKITGYTTKVSGRPSYESYSWGDKRSWVAWTLYHAITVLRFFSPLQHVKYVIRKSYRAKLHSSLEKKARPDFHAANSELYMLGVLLGAVLARYLSSDLYSVVAANVPQLAPAIFGIGWALLVVLLVESVQWTFYYALFRPLLERVKLNLYDEAEYFIMLPVVLATQILLLSLLWDKTVGQVGLMLLNAADPGVGPGAAQPVTTHCPPLIAMSARAQVLTGALMGQAYIVVVIASLIRVVPTLHVRRRPTITVIGYGDVVQNRILPAMNEVYHRHQIAVASDRLTLEEKAILRSQGIQYHSAIDNLAKPKANRDTKEHPTEQDVIENVTAWVAARSKFAIVAVPTPHHLEYATQLANQGMRFALEKPIVGTSTELDLIEKRANEKLFEEIFVFSYYWLEKGLSTNYVLTLNPTYRSMLDIEPNLPAQEISLLLDQMGAMQRMTSEFMEPGETAERYWTELPANGGMVMETLVHPLTFVVNFARSIQAYSRESGLWTGMPEVKWRRNTARAAEIGRQHNLQIGPTFVEIHGTIAGQVEVRIRCGKYLVTKETRSRAMAIEYENGAITIDLDTMMTRLFSGPPEDRQLSLTISNKTLLDSQTKRKKDSHDRKPYQSQIDLMNNFFNDGWGGIRFDDYPSQLDVLHELVAFSRQVITLDMIPGDNDIDARPWIPNDILVHPKPFAVH